MSKKYHIKKDGSPGVCTAQHSCPLGGENEHFNTLEEAQEYADKKNKFSEESKFSTSSLMKKLTSSQKRISEKIKEFFSQENIEKIETLSEEHSNDTKEIDKNSNNQESVSIGEIRLVKLLEGEVLTPILGTNGRGFTDPSGVKLILNKKNPAGDNMIINGVRQDIPKSYFEAVKKIHAHHVFGSRAKGEIEVVLREDSAGDRRIDYKFKSKDGSNNEFYFKSNFPAQNRFGTGKLIFKDNSGNLKEIEGISRQKIESLLKYNNEDFNTQEIKEYIALQKFGNTKIESIESVVSDYKGEDPFSLQEKEHRKIIKLAEEDKSKIYELLTEKAAHSMPKYSDLESGEEFVMEEIRSDGLIYRVSYDKEYEENSLEILRENKQGNEEQLYYGPLIKK